MSSNSKYCPGCHRVQHRPTKFRVIGENTHNKIYSKLCIECERAGVKEGHSREVASAWGMPHLAQDPGFDVKEYMSAIAARIRRDGIGLPPVGKRLKVREVPDIPREALVMALRAANRDGMSLWDRLRQEA